MINRKCSKKEWVEEKFDSLPPLILRYFIHLFVHVEHKYLHKIIPRKNAKTKS